VSQVYIRKRQRDAKPFDISSVKWISACFFPGGQTAVRTLAIRVATVTLLGCALVPAGATTLLQLSMQEMAQDATAIARVRILGASERLRGTDVFTVYQFETLETMKKPAVGRLQTVAVPGGSAGGIRQMVSGAPVLRPGGEYVVFLWTGRSGLTQIVGLSQGVFTVDNAGAQPARVTRPTANEQMLDAQGRAVQPEPVSMPLTQLRSVVAQAVKREGR
jgi:hypothetical protein